MKRRELKYFLSPEQKAYFTDRLAGRMQPDEFGLTSIASLYYDTPDRRLVRASLDNTEFKEKIRLRSYGIASEGGPVFLELKRKAEGIVYKRRVRTTLGRVRRFFGGEGALCDGGGQIEREISYFCGRFAPLSPSCLIIYDRTAYFEPGGDLRLTIDGSPRYRTEELDLTRGMDGAPLLPPDWSILEIKVQEAMPLWLSVILAEGRIYKTNFSKVGEAYKKEMKNVFSKEDTVCSIPSIPQTSPLRNSSSWRPWRSLPASRIPG
jgi:hypothetical protein